MVSDQPRTCIVPDCPKARQRGLDVCSMHETRMRRTGSYDAPPRAHASPAERLMRRVRKTETCWLWTGTTNNMGYGTMSVTANGRQRTIFTHRLSYEVHIGAIPDGALLLHACDTPNCVNPDHLSPGTHSENTIQMYERGRGRPGTRRRRHA